MSLDVNFMGNFNELIERFLYFRSSFINNGVIKQSGLRGTPCIKSFVEIDRCSVW